MIVVSMDFHAHVVSVLPMASINYGTAAVGLAGKSRGIMCLLQPNRLALMAFRLAFQSGGRRVRHGKRPARSRFQGIESWGKWPPE